MAKITSKQAREVANGFISDINRNIKEDIADPGRFVTCFFADICLALGYIQAIADFGIMDEKDIEMFRKKVSCANKNNSIIKKLGDC